MKSSARDRDAEFTAWVSAHRPQLLRAAYLICGDSHAAEDLVQTCLTRLYLAWPRFAEMGLPLSYARRALVNAHIDLTRHAWWARERPFAAPDSGAVMMDEAALVDEREAVVRALQQLPSGQRHVIVLRFLWGLSVRETAAELEISEGTVKSQTFDALRRLEQALAIDRLASDVRSAD
jgi:RNA polymerase sigma-70 factor (sigma-E family)